MLGIKKRGILTAGSVIGAVLLSAVHAAAAGLAVHTPDHVRTLSLDTDYRSTPYSDRAVTDFNMEMLQGYGFLNNTFYDWQDQTGKNDNIFLKAAWETFNLGLNYLLSSPFTLANHEIGHGIRMKAAGSTPSFSLAKSSIEGPTDQTTFNMFNFYFSSLKTKMLSYDHGYTTATTPYTLSAQFLNLSVLDQAKVNFLISAGGIGSEMHSAEAMSDMVYQHGGHVSYIVPYTVMKTAAYFYSGANSAGDDLTRLVNYYNNTRGYNISRNAIKNASLISFLLSSSTYVMYGSYLGYLHNGDQSLSGYTYAGFRLPDLFSYTTSSGLSYKVVSGYQVSDSLDIPFSLEHVYSGDRVDEFGIGWDKRFSGWSASGMLYAGKGVSFQGALALYLGKKAAISVGTDYYNKNTLHGERHTFDYYKKSSYKVWSKLTWRYQ